MGKRFPESLTDRVNAAWKKLREEMWEKLWNERYEELRREASGMPPRDKRKEQGP